MTKGIGFIGFVMYIILLVVFLGLIEMIFNLHRFAFVLELLILLVLFVISLVAVMGMHSKFPWVWKLFKWFFVLVFLNMLLVYALSTPKPVLFFLFMVVVIVGFFVSLFMIPAKEEEAGEVTKEFKPGKYIASKTGAKFHAPKCDWAKRIKKSNAVWFDSKKEAREAGYQDDDCVK